MVARFSDRFLWPSLDGCQLGRFRTEFTWDYSKGARPGLDKLYEKAKRSQWNAETDLDWSIEVDPLGSPRLCPRRLGW